MRDFKNCSVAILTGGFGTRLAPVVSGKPKVLAEVSKRPFLDYILNQLNNAHFKKVVLCTGYLSEQIEKTFGNRYKNLHLLYSTERSALGTAGSLRKALPLFTSETILAMNGDSFCDVSFKKLWQFHVRNNSKATIVLGQVPDVRRFGSVTLAANDAIQTFHEKTQTDGPGFVSAGIYVIQKSLLTNVPSGKKLSIERNVFPTWIGNGLYGYKTNQRFIDIGTPESLTAAKQFLAKIPI